MPVTGIIGGSTGAWADVLVRSIEVSTSSSDIGALCSLYQALKPSYLSSDALCPIVQEPLVYRDSRWGTGSL